MPLRGCLLSILLLGAPVAAQPRASGDLIQVLQQRHCPDCQLADADLVHADLRDAQLAGARLQRANLGEARLDGADLSGSDLSFTSLRGASLRGADLRGSRLYGTDLRHADLSGAHLDAGALDQSHWQGARGIDRGLRSHASLHNAGVDAARSGRWVEAERLFNAAILENPKEALSWVARGLSRGEQGKHDLAGRDLAHAGWLFEQQGDPIKADQLKRASTRVHEPADADAPTGNGLGSAVLGSMLSTVQALAPIALKALMPMMP